MSLHVYSLSPHSTFQSYQSFASEAQCCPIVIERPSRQSVLPGFTSSLSVSKWWWSHGHEGRSSDASWLLSIPRTQMPTAPPPAMVKWKSKSSQIVEGWGNQPKSRVYLEEVFKNTLQFHIADCFLWQFRSVNRYSCLGSTKLAFTPHRRGARREMVPVTCCESYRLIVAHSGFTCGILFFFLTFLYYISNT